MASTAAPSTASTAAAPSTASTAAANSTASIAPAPSIASIAAETLASAAAAAMASTAAPSTASTTVAPSTASTAAAPSIASTAAVAVSSHAASSANRSALRDDENGVPRSLRLLASHVEADAIRYAAAASRPAKSELLRAFRGGAAANRTSTVSITEFLDRVQRFISLESVRHVIRLEGTSYVLAGIYLNRFMRSRAARKARILIEPTTVHRLVAVALFLGAKFGGPDDTLPRKWTFVFEVSSDGAIRACEIADLEERFLRAIDFRLFVNAVQFDWFCGVLERAPPPSRSCSGSKRNLEVEEIEGEDQHRCIRARLPAPAVIAN